MKAKRILQSALAVIMAAMMMLLASCGTAEDVSADGENRLTRAEEEAENAEVTAKEDTAKPTGEATGEEAADTADETTTNAETSTDAKKMPEKPIYYDEYIIDAITGKVFLATDFAEPGTNGNTIFRTNDSPSYCGVKDKGGNTVIEAMYTNLKGNADNTYFYFELNDANGILNDKGEIIIKGLDIISADLVYTNIFYPENIITNTSIYSLPSGELIGEYEQINVFSDEKTFLVTGSNKNDSPYAKIIDSKGNQIADLLSDSPVTADQISSIDIAYYPPTIKEKPLIAVRLISNDEYFYSLFNNKGEKIEGWIQVPQNGYGVSYLYSNIVTNSLRSDDNAWLVNVYDYSGKKLGSFEKEFSINGKVFKEEDSNVFLRTDGSKIGEFSEYSYEPVAGGTMNWSNAVIVTDTDGMFKGVIIGDELKYPCEYTNILYLGGFYKVGDIDGFSEWGNYQLLMLQKGSETIYITAETGAVVDLPQ
jgi:hypothetical protein